MLSLLQVLKSRSVKPKRVTLLRANRTRDDVPSSLELPDFTKVVDVIESRDGYISADTLRAHMRQDERTQFYVSGPDAMLKSMS